MNVDKMAKVDAERWAFAEMFFGEGAGTKRKLLGAEIDDKCARIPGYMDTFNNALNDVNYAKAAIAAEKARKHLDRTSFVVKNARALVRGDLRNVSPLIYAAAAGAYFAHQTGYDKKAYNWVKLEAEILKIKAERRISDWKARREGRNVLDMDRPYGGL